MCGRGGPNRAGRVAGRGSVQIPSIGSVADEAASFLDSLQPADRDDLMALVRRRRFDRGESVFRGGADEDSFALLLSGRVKLVAQTQSGRAIVVGLRGPGELLGELAVLSGQPRSADVLPVEPVEVGVGPGDALRQFFDRRPRALLALCLLLADRLREADRGLVELASLPGDVRVGVRLLELADRYGRAEPAGTYLSVPLSQDELADWTGLSRQAVARALADLRGLRLVDTARRSIVVSDVAALRARVAEQLQGRS